MFVVHHFSGQLLSHEAVTTERLIEASAEALLLGYEQPDSFVVLANTSRPSSPSEREMVAGAFDVGKAAREERG